MIFGDALYVSEIFSSRNTFRIRHATIFFCTKEFLFLRRPVFNNFPPLDISPTKEIFFFVMHRVLLHFPGGNYLKNLWIIHENCILADK